MFFSGLNDSRGGFCNAIFRRGIERRSKERYNVVIIAEAVNRNPFFTGNISDKTHNLQGIKL